MTERVELLVPHLGDGIAEVVLVAWRVALEGAVVEGEPVFEIETDKAVFEVEAEVSGVLVEVRVAVGEPVAPGASVGSVEVA